MSRAFSKIWIIVILFVVIAGGIFVWWYINTFSWQTYYNKQFGLSVKIPPQYYSLEEDIAGIYYLYTKDENAAIGEKDNKFIASQVVVWVNPMGGVYLEENKQLIEELRALEIGTHTKEGQSIEKRDNVDIRGCKGNIIQRSPSADVEEIAMICWRETAINSGLSISITVAAKPGLIAQYEKTFQQIISTLSFEHKVVENWPFYTSDEFGIFFRYPSVYDTEQKFEQCKPYVINEGKPDQILFVGPLSVHMEDSQGLSLTDYAEQKAQELVTAQRAPEIYESKLISKTKRKLYTKEAWVVVGRIVAAGTYHEPYNTYVEHKDKILNFNIDNSVLGPCLLGEGQEPNDVAQQILSTIQFK